MGETLESMKSKISAHYLGKAGIHAVGVRRSANAITVYIDAIHDGEAEADQEQTLQELRRDAAPFAVVTKEAAPPRFL